MKTKNLKSLKLNKKSVSNLNLQKISGAGLGSAEANCPLQTARGTFCNVSVCLANCPDCQ